ncbi:MAG: tRNA (N6-threonylcarbamoyladenosine(37)-N6)-methyltransferase TrmO [Smithella sp.]|nr:tRNA (N6-threonylcarbamoyladenosine(37)-N6)-methyltransferase TrmO [Smithella sp.]MDM7987745.1 tRNA (N6-threonylcarbamoyladenosine(37)-N6)-methyltransferase TrmO [Smithella sp.]HOU51338.1 tRNA (N6-threonylcarbamoyladenosine(37)-N6)-methyltransferase TrmO [Smithella sp.]HQG66138.1 tRNA (N6-threonylcarbamoyladenosine(37)-N6)-methyltransferase TrmO [Smithella sp.]HQI73335.1 tRNA (N6-threonylcarbamoyladenosine(37)-N6)-methyltransferase TrmO [Smithella sp.]
MNKCEILYWTIGIIHSEHIEEEKTPIQPVYAKGCKGYVELFPEFVDGLRDLNGFSHIYLIYHFHRVQQVKLIVKPYLQDVYHGIFATRAPFRPNPIGLSVVELHGIEGNILHLDGVDVLDGTPLLDIKPYTAKFDLHDVKKNGWQDAVDNQTAAQRGKRGHQS